MTNILSFAVQQDYYTTSRIIVDAIIGFIFGWMLFGYSIWSSMTFATIMGIIILIVSGTSMKYGRKWLGIAAIVGAVLTTIFYFYVTLPL